MCETNKDFCVADFQRTSYYPTSFKCGRGALLYDYNGKEYIDFLASASSANLGHGNEEIANAVFNQMKKITQYVSLYFPMPEGEILAKKLVDLVGNKNMRVAYSNSGSGAIDCAIKLAKAYMHGLYEYGNLLVRDGKYIGVNM